MTDRRALACLSLVVLAVLAGSAEARVYRWTDDQGNPVYSDRPAPRAAVDDAAARDAQVDEILELSGFTRQLRRMPEEIQARIREQRAASPRPDVHDRIAETYARVLTTEALENRVRAVFVERFDVGHALAYLEWARGSVSRRLNAAEAEAASPAGRAQLARYAATLQKVPPPVRRAGLIRQVVEVTGVVDVSLDVLFAMARATARAIDAAQPPGKKMKPGQLEAQISAARQKAWEPMRVNAVVTLLFTYRSLPDEDLEAYAAFYATPSGQWYVDVARRAFVDALSGLIEAAMAEVAPAAVSAPQR
jgi:hypothetical protein